MRTASKINKFQSAAGDCDFDRFAECELLLYPIRQPKQLTISRSLWADYGLAENGKWRNFEITTYGVSENGRLADCEISRLGGVGLHLSA
jgi:hypothetical protein